VRAFVVALKQRVVRAVVRQFGHPHGIGGRLAGWVMAHRSSELSRRATRGTVYGIDHSEVMLQHATKRNGAAIRAKHVELVRAHPVA
jgi:hypothetical protein